MTTVRAFAARRRRGRQESFFDGEQTGSPALRLVGQHRPPARGWCHTSALAVDSNSFKAPTARVPLARPTPRARPALAARPGPAARPAPAVRPVLAARP